MSHRAVLCIAAILSSVACASAPAPPNSPTPPDACPAPGPLGTASPLSGKVTIAFKNEMSSLFALRRVLIGLDGAAICWLNLPAGAWTDSINADSIPTFSALMSDGDHELKILLMYVGRESKRIDLRNYRFEIRSSHIFHVERAKLVELSVIPYERGVQPPEDRPAVRYVERLDGAHIAPAQTQTP